MSTPLGARPAWAGYTQTSGFDDTATPPWQLVAHRGIAKVHLFDDVGMQVQSVNPGIAKIIETTFDDNFPVLRRRDFEITGVMPGPPTFIELFDADGRRSPVRLEVQVRPARLFKIAFQFVLDDAKHDGTPLATRATSLVADLLATLKHIYEFQTNIRFGNWDTAPAVRVATTLQDLVREHTNVRDPRAGWGKLQAKFVAGADLNVFFMPSVGSKAKHPAMLEDGVCVCGDGMSDDELAVALPHMIGQSMACPVTRDDKLQDHLMFHSRAAGDGSRDIAIIPKDCSVMMNWL